MTAAAHQNRRFTVDGDTIIVDLFEPERGLLEHLLPQLREMLMAGDDDALRRLRPPARPDDAEAERHYRDLVDDDLLLARLEAIETVEQGLDGARLDSEGVEAWMKSLNALRLVVGELLAGLGVDLAADTEPKDQPSPTDDTDPADHASPIDDTDPADHASPIDDTDPGDHAVRVRQMRGSFDWLGAVMWDLVDTAASMLPDD